MNKKLIARLLALGTVACGLSFPAIAQKTKSSEAAFYKDAQLFLSAVTKGTKRFAGDQVKISKSKLPETDQIVNYPQQVSDRLSIPEGMVFFQGLKSPHANEWVYLERTIIGDTYNLWRFDAVSGKKTLAFKNESAPDVNYAFKPIAWSNSADVVYLEALEFDSDKGHAGIWEYNLKTGKSRRINVGGSYMSTPVMSPDRSHLLYLATTESKRNLIHGVTDMVVTYDLQAAQEKVLSKEAGVMHYVTGWTEGEVGNKNLLELNAKDPSEKEKTSVMATQIPFKLPWTSGVSYCVSRTGSPAPTGTYTSQGYCGSPYTGYNPHGYIAIDFDTPNSVYDAIRAVAPGTVTFAGVKGDYGNLVIVTHSDNTQTYYAHLYAISVSLNQCVGQGAVLGDGGTTGQSSGDHLHFEWRSPGGSTLMYAKFDEAAGIPRQAYKFTSANTPAACGAAADVTAPTTSISAPSTTVSGDFTATFTDADNVGIVERYYQVLEFGSEWRANRGNGFFNDNFNGPAISTEWTAHTGTWAVTADKRLKQSNATLTNTNIATAITQGSGQSYLYHFAAKLVSSATTAGTGRFGIHIFSDNVSMQERNNSYLIWFTADEQKVRIYETVNNVLNLRATQDAVIIQNNWNDYKVTYNASTGLINVYINDKLEITWTDTTPYTAGSGISLRTNQADVEWDDVKVYKSRSTSKVVTVGPESFKDARKATPAGTTTPTCKVKSLARDAAHNWSNLGNLDLMVTFPAGARMEDISGGMQVFPNPVDNTATLSYSLEESGHVTISAYDMQGKQIATLVEGEQQKGEHLVAAEKLATLKPGMYLIRMQSTKTSSVLKIIKN